MLRHRRATRRYRRIFLFLAPSYLKLLSWIALFLKTDIWASAAVLGDNGTGYQKTERMVTLCKRNDSLLLEGSWGGSFVPVKCQRMLGHERPASQRTCISVHLMILFLRTDVRFVGTVRLVGFQPIKWGIHRCSIT
ncbi:hypothetical protein AVEN_154327-1 [Araneus ventricosus]|uniref:Uncharacterized protein n=1 Tax=Araneus ventricosus TaxID=182803 RepID=A0A4Y2VTJ7_ARAVE|nr:hypothetical protein AVEN_154327-1 [Araneus ventricosus]